MKIHHLGLMIVFVLSSVVTTAEEFEIGTLGAAIELDDTWERRMINPDLGADQFVSIKGLYCFVTEYQGLLDGRFDLERLVSTMVDSLPTTMEMLENQAATAHENGDGVVRVTRRLAVRMSGLKLVYQFDAVGRDGLAYLFMTWAAASRETDLNDWASRVARSLSMPPDDSEWGSSAKPARNAFRFGERVVELEYRPSLLIEYWVEDDDGVTTLATHDDELAIHLAIFENTDPVDTYLDDILEYFEFGASSTNELDRSAVEVDFGRGRQIRSEFTDADGSFVFALAAIPVSDDLILDLRMVVMASAWTEGREELWSNLVSSLRVTQDPTVDAYPEPSEDASEAIARNDAAQAILAQSTKLAESWGWNNHIEHAPDGRIFAMDGDSVFVLNNEGEGEEEVVFEFSDWVQYRVLDWWSGELLVLGPGGEVAVVEEDLRPLGISAQDFAVIDDDHLLVVSTREAPDVLGYLSLPVNLPTEMIAIGRGGEQRTIATLNRETIGSMSVSPNGRTAMFTVRNDAGIEPMALEEGSSIRLIDLDGGEPRGLETWQSVDGITGTPGGWLVSGSPTDEPNGLYLLQNDGRRELLMTGEASGLSLEDGILTFAANLHMGDDTVIGPTHTVYSSPIDLIREHGASVRPFTVETFNLIAAEAAEGASDLSTVDGLRTHLETADQASRRIAGLPLPSGATAVDRLLTELSYATDLSPAAIGLLSAMLCEVFLGSGGRWIDGSDAPTDPATWATGWVGDGLFSVAIQPRQMVRNTLFSEEGWWNPAEYTIDTAAGRTILLGAEEESLETALQSDNSSEVNESIGSGSRKKIRRLLDENSDNTYLRQQVYRQLAARSEFKIMESIAGKIISNGEPGADDWRAWAAARHRLAEPGDDAEPEIEGLRRAISRNPEDPSLYLLLGATYERSARTDRLDLARACFLKVAELRTWGRFSEEAAAGLERVGEPSIAE